MICILTIYLYLLSFQFSFSIDGDSDSLSEFRDISPIKSPLIDETASNASFKMNGFSQNRYSQLELNKRTNGRDMASDIGTSNGRHKNTSDAENVIDLTNEVHSSPSRSQLGLNLKAPTLSIRKPVDDFQVGLALLAQISL